MPDRPARRALARDAGLVVAAVYEREVAASRERVWENVRDWAHLPWLHAGAFASIERLAEGDWGWHARVGFQGGAEAEIELIVDLEGSRYVTRTLEGAGAPGEIWTAIEPLGPRRTGIRVEFAVPPAAPDQIEGVGHALVSLYRTLWDEDEDMMRRRAEALDARESPQPPATRVQTTPLGTWDDLRPRLPLVVEVAGHAYRLVESEGRLLVHSTVCPHRLGPLDECPVEAGIVTCPWHGFRFDAASGRSVDGRGLRLRAAPRVETDPSSGTLRLVLDEAQGRSPEDGQGRDGEGRSGVSGWIDDSCC
ncbi:MAG TPA: Rieske 2Fe-2S domain-containing protein [Myxococcota bacterium]|nr:Rieske 2Fe-2S domain-containing protein [Myxococcota bacterium]